jgi:hypothetical protein
MPDKNDAGAYHPRPIWLHIRTFECPACHRIHQTVVALADPMKAPEVTGWFQGELRAPTRAVAAGLVGVAVVRERGALCFQA